MKIHVFLVGSKGIPARYGGFESFLENLTARRMDQDIQYHVSCMGNQKENFLYHNAECFFAKVPLPGAAGRILYVSNALKKVEKWEKQHRGEKTIVYILGCRIGPLLIPHSHALRKLGIKIFVNPDGLEWKRSKWSRLVRKFLRYCEACLVKYADLVICDSRNIESYIRKTYPALAERTCYIAYGADAASPASRRYTAEAGEWAKKNRIRPGEYYLIVGRFVPENNYETMLREFMESNTDKDLVIITNAQGNRYFDKLKEKTGFDKDKRIKFTGTVYDPSLLKAIRENSYAYLHGHEVGGTNPSLLEALASTKVNLLLDVGFNKEVGGDAALFWTKESGNLKSLIDRAEQLKPEERETLGNKANQRIRNQYSWDFICGQYESLWKRTEGDCV